LSAKLSDITNWNYRKTDQRIIIIKTKNKKVRKAAVLDVLTNLTFAISVPDNISMESLIPEKEYLAQLKVYTSRNNEGIDKEFINFFDTIDVDQATEDFIKNYWIYPSSISFELTELDEP
jgi:hypothetical protein